LTREGITKNKTYKKRDQFAPELLYFSKCILQGKDPEPSGIEGLIDVGIIRAAYQSAFSRKPVLLGLRQRSRRPDLKQEVTRPAVIEPDLIHAQPPSGKNG
jgi:hypothetical protein